MIEEKDRYLDQENTIINPDDNYFPKINSSEFAVIHRLDVQLTSESILYYLKDSYNEVKTRLKQFIQNNETFPNTEKDNFLTAIFERARSQIEMVYLDANASEKEQKSVVEKSQSFLMNYENAVQRILGGTRQNTQDNNTAFLI